LLGHRVAAMASSLRCASGPPSLRSGVLRTLRVLVEPERLRPPFVSATARESG
jgi:hypothetical protein